MQKTIRLM